MKPASETSGITSLVGNMNFKTFSMLVILVALIFSFGSVHAAISGSKPVISEGVLAESGDPTFVAKKSSSEKYVFYSDIDIPAGGPKIGADLYFGVMSTLENKSFTWVKGSNGGLLLAGMSPLSKNIDMNAPSHISVSDILGGSASYKFTGSESTGMYLVFSILVVANSDPADPKNWIAVRMEPLIVQ